MLYIYFWGGGGGELQFLRPWEQQFTSWIENTNHEWMYFQFIKICSTHAAKCTNRSKPTFKVRCLYSSFVQASTGYKHCLLPRAKVFRLTVQHCTLSLIYTFWKCSVLVILPRLNSTQIETRPRIGYLSATHDSTLLASYWFFSFVNKMVRHHSLNFFFFLIYLTLDIIVISK
jgi:hypothetical protein